MYTVRLPRTFQKLSKHPAKTIMALLQLHKRFAALAVLIVVVTLYLVNARPPTEIESLPGMFLTSQTSSEEVQERLTSSCRVQHDTSYVTLGFARMQNPFYVSMFWIPSMCVIGFP